MELSLLGTAQSKLGTSDSVSRDVVSLNFSRNSVYSGKSRVDFTKKSIKFGKASIRYSVKVAAQSEKASDFTTPSRKKSKPGDDVRLYVGLPLDSVSECCSVKHARAISAGLRVLKVLGVDGVELPIWWGVAEKEAMGIYDWSGYLSIAELVKRAGLKLHVSLCFHASKEPNIPLPKWVSRIGESRPSIYFSDRLGLSYKECLSLGVDDLPVLDGKTPGQVYKEFCDNFKMSFSCFMGSTITGVSVGLGPDGELRYPSYHQSSKNTSLGAGEFQCYDENMIAHLKKHAETQGRGLSGPHHTPSYFQSPISNTFFKEEGGSWETAYGDFFLSWYSSQLASHGDRILSLAASTFSDTDVTVSGKVPLLHSWNKTCSHASELTSGFYNTVHTDGYEGIIEMFSRHSCKMIMPCMDLSDESQPNDSHSSPELLASQITESCRKRGVEVSGHSLIVSGATKNFERIRKNLLSENGDQVDLFLYQRMGAEFFSPDHFSSFTAFVRNLYQPALDSDDLIIDESQTGKDLRKQAA